MYDKSIKSKNKKGDENMECVLEQITIADKLSILRKNASKIKKDDKLRHDVNEYDINLVNQNTKLMVSHQIKTIRNEE